MRLSPAFGFSLLLHGLLLLALFLSGKFEPRTPHDSGPLEVRIVTARPKGSEGGGATQRPVGPQTLRNALPEVSHLGKLGLKDYLSTKDKSGESTGTGTRGKPDGYDVANTIGTEKEAQLYPFVRAVWQKIDLQVDYPKDFTKQRIEGRVAVHFVVDRRGVFTGKFLKVDSDSPYFKVYVLALLVHALREPLRESLWTTDSDKDKVLVANFDFRLFTYGEIPAKREIPLFKNILSFERMSYNQPIVNEKIDKFMTRYIPPIIPVPGGAYIDFIRAYQLLANIGTPDPDDLTRERVSRMKERWESVIMRD